MLNFSKGVSWYTRIAESKPRGKTQGNVSVCNVSKVLHFGTTFVKIADSLSFLELLRLEKSPPHTNIYGKYRMVAVVRKNVAQESFAWY